MTNLSLFFWLLPITVAVIATMFVVTTRLEQRHRTAKIAAIGFGVAFVAILLDTQRAHLPWWAFSLAVPLHWLVLVGIVDAFLVRHNDRLPRLWLWPMLAIGSAINFGFTFVMNDAAVRVPNASVICVLILSIATLRLARFRQRPLDWAIFLVIAANLFCYTARTVLWFYLDQYEGYMRDSAFSDYMTMFYFSSGIAMFAIALLIMLAIINDIVERNRIDANMDALTGVLNRRGFNEVIDAARQSAAGVGAIIAIDLDQFKIINDRFGHAGGDQVLASVAEILRSHCLHFGSVARMGGEEFIIIIKQTHAAAAQSLAETLRVAIGALRLPGFPNDFQITTSIGVAHLHDAEHIEEACRRADVALYVAKSEGRNCVVLSDPIEDINSGLDAAVR